MIQQHPFVVRGRPAMVLAPMDGITDFLMRDFLTGFQAWNYVVTEFIRVSQEAPPRKVFVREVPELGTGCVTQAKVPVQVQILGGDPEKMAQAATSAVEAGALGIDINFGCPAPTVNRHDGGATLLKFPERIERIISSVRATVPRGIPVSAKLRLGWDDSAQIYENAQRAERGGASWITIHGRTKTQGYTPPAYWHPIGTVRRSLGIPVVANGEIWTLDDLRRCQDDTGCEHFMVGRGALARPWIVGEMRAAVSGVALNSVSHQNRAAQSWAELFAEFNALASRHGESDRAIVSRMKHWLKLAEKHAGFALFDQLKRLESPREIIAVLHYDEHQLAA